MPSIKKHSFIFLAVLAFILIATPSFAGTVNYYYDLNDQLILAELTNGTSGVYTYDLVGNREETETGTVDDLDSDGDGTPDGTDVAPYDPLDSGVILSLANTLDGNLHGNGYGDDAYYSLLAATFQGDGTDRLLHVQGYDVDYTDEIGVYLNDTLLGYLTGIDNSPGPDSLWWLTPDMQETGENRVEFKNTYPSESWGVQRLGIYNAGVEIGNIAGADTSHAEGFELHVDGADAKLLELSVWDDSALDGAMEVFINDSSVGVMPVNNSPGWGTWYQMLLPSDYLYAGGGDNIVFMENSLGVTDEWGVKLNALRTAGDDAEYGYDGVNPSTTVDGAALLVPAYGGDQEVSVQFRNVSTSEVEITSNDGFTDYAPPTTDWGDVYTVYSGPGRLGRVDFNNLSNPPGTETWGVRVTGEGLVPFAPNKTISGGWGHTLAIKADGTAWAWGRNYLGRLGNDSQVDSAVPVTVIKDSDSTALTGVVGVAGGGDHSAAIDNEGHVWTWGRNNYGQLGIASPSYKLKAVQVPGLTNAVAVAAGHYHTAALRSDGTVWTWGWNNFGQLGIGNTTSHSSPVEVEGLTNVVAIASGGYHVLALRSDGTVRAWGYNVHGELGDSSTTNRLSPVEAGITDVIAIYAGTYHSFAITSIGDVYAWGFNNYGQLGDGTTANRTSPVQVKGVGGSGYLSGVKEIVGGVSHTIALKSDGSVLAWGDNRFGQLGDNTITGSSTPVLIGSGGYAEAIAAGSRHTVVLRPGGTTTAWAWGYNGYGQLGTGVFSGKLTPWEIENVPELDVVAGGYLHALGIDTDETVRAWGYNNFGQLGDGSKAERIAPVQASGITNAVDIDGGFHHSVALTRDEKVRTWGWNAFGQLGDGTSTDRWSPTVVTGISNAIDVAAGGYHTAALDPDGDVWTWGYNGYGQLGNGTTYDSLTPGEVTGIANAVDAISVGGYHTVVLDSYGKVWVWGRNNAGQLGLGDETDRHSPVQVTGISNTVQAISAGQFHTLALDSSGTVWAWGDNWQGQVGNGSTDSKILSPVGVLTGVDAISAGGWHSLALKNDGTVRAWGYNGEGEVGDGTMTNSNVPVQVTDPTDQTGYLTDVDSLSAGGHYSLAIKTDGSVWGWGWNAYFQLGSVTDPDEPVVTQFSQ